MKHVDKYWFFVNSAISEPIKKPNFVYFVDNLNKLLIRRETINFSKKHENWIELPKLTTVAKKEFLISFANEQKEDSSQSLIMEIIAKFNDTSSFEIHNELRNYDRNLALNFYFQSGTFLNSAINRLYSEFDLSDKMRIDLEGEFSEP